MANTLRAEMLAGMTGLQIGIFAGILGAGVGVSSIVGYFRWRRWKQQIQTWQDFAATRGWSFMPTPGGFMYSAGTLKMEGSYAGRPLTLETEYRHQQKAYRIATIVRHELGDDFPREVVIRPEGLGDKFLKLFGVQDEQIGDAGLDAVLDLKNVTPQARAILLSAGMRRPLLNLARAFETFSIENGVLSAEVIDDVPCTPIELYGLLTPVRELADAVQGTRGHTQWRSEGAGQEGTQS
ncbi:hypothetical protein BHS05_04955 [Myxococcus xanthus]|nr:hypothetical protein BHS05_04955 [Myxococcus xanthus]